MRSLILFAELHRFAGVRAGFFMDKHPLPKRKTKKVFHVRKIFPTHVPFECPVCNGYGTVGKAPNEKECHGCGGLGWVVVEQDYGVETDIV